MVSLEVKGRAQPVLWLKSYRESHLLSKSRHINCRFCLSLEATPEMTFRSVLVFTLMKVYVRQSISSLVHLFPICFHSSCSKNYLFQLTYVHTSRFLPRSCHIFYPYQLLATLSFNLLRSSQEAFRPLGSTKVDKFARFKIHHTLFLKHFRSKFKNFRPLASSKRRIFISPISWIIHSRPLYH